MNKSTSILDDAFDYAGAVLFQQGGGGGSMTVLVRLDHKCIFPSNNTEGATAL